MIIGILAVQGAFIEHHAILKKMHVDSFLIRTLEDLKKPMDGIILPGGESTAMHRLLVDFKMMTVLKDLIHNGLYAFGTCAGMILLAKRIIDHEKTHLNLMDITVKRNAYGRQLGSFITHDLFNQTKIPMTFIRAPYVDHVGKDVEVLSVVDGHIVAVREKHMLATAFHPELTSSTVVHEYFIHMIQSKHS